MPHDTSAACQQSALDQAQQPLASSPRHPVIAGQSFCGSDEFQLVRSPVAYRRLFLTQLTACLLHLRLRSVLRRSREWSVELQPTTKRRAHLSAQILHGDLTVADLLRSVWPRHAAKNAARAAQGNVATAKRWVQGRTTPSADTLLRMAAANETLRAELVRRLGSHGFAESGNTHGGSAPGALDSTRTGDAS